MRTTEFSYELPDQAISREPKEPRDASKLLVSRHQSELVDSHVFELGNYLDDGDLVVVNNTKVLPARVPIVRKSGGKGEIFLLNRISNNLWSALVRPSKKIEVGETVVAIGKDKEYIFQIGNDIGLGHRQILFLSGDEQEILSDVGRTPLPPYLGEIDIPIERYQTMFAKEDRSVAAPTAGLHFTNRLLHSLSDKKINVCEITLHVGVGTFRPIMVANIEDHIMHKEYYCVEPEVWEQVIETKQKGKKICAVGTTSLRTLETVAINNKLTGSTDIYCHSDYNFQIVDYLFTNFHQPESTLLVLLDSFIGSRWKGIYEHALTNGYRFLSFGDAMLVEKKKV